MIYSYQHYVVWKHWPNSPKMPTMYLPPTMALNGTMTMMMEPDQIIEYLRLNDLTHVHRFPIRFYTAAKDRFIAFIAGLATPPFKNYWTAFYYSNMDREGDIFFAFRNASDAVMFMMLFEH